MIFTLWNDVSVCKSLSAALNTPSLEHDVIFQSINQGFAILLGSWSSLTFFVFIKMLLKPLDITSSTEQRMQTKASLAEDPDFGKTPAASWLKKCFWVCEGSQGAWKEKRLLLKYFWGLKGQRIAEDNLSFDFLKIIF